MYIKINRNTLLIAGSMLIISTSSCKKFLAIDLPRTDLVRSAVFTSDATAKAAVTDMYSQIGGQGFASGNTISVTFLNSMASDELVNYFLVGVATTIVNMKQLSDNQLLPNNSTIASLWTDAYKCIYKTNAILEGLSQSAGVSDAMKKQLEGEARFIRAFCYFYLVNLYGDIPLITTTDYKLNSTFARNPKTEVYQAIINDLKIAQSKLAIDYSFSNNDRVRVNKWVATSLLARVYLYTGDWVNAETESSSVLNNTSLYSLVPDLTKVFHRNSKEAIWQFSTESQYANDAVYFYIFSAPPENAALSSQLVGAFETGDARRTQWIGSISGGGTTYYFPVKYYSFANKEQFSTVIRLAEIYLIRAEARARQGKVTGSNSAETDINIIRTRSGLGNTSATTQSLMLSAIEHERRVELFTEWGHRWFDLIRMSRADAVLGSLKPGWQPTDKFFPIPESEILINPALVQNPGY